MRLVRFLWTISVLLVIASGCGDDSTVARGDAASLDGAADLGPATSLEGTTPCGPRVCQDGEVCPEENGGVEVGVVEPSRSRRVSRWALSLKIARTVRRPRRPPRKRRYRRPSAPRGPQESAGPFHPAAAQSAASLPCRGRAATERTSGKSAVAVVEHQSFGLAHEPTVGTSPPDANAPGCAGCADVPLHVS